jgi:hypothetical protein
LPPAASQEWKQALQRLDEQEVMNEKKLCRDASAMFLTPSSVHNSSLWLSRFFNEPEPEREQQHHQQGMPQPGCAHQ